MELLRLAGNETDYLSYFWWKVEGPAHFSKDDFSAQDHYLVGGLESGLARAMCRLCAALHSRTVGRCVSLLQAVELSPQAELPGPGGLAGGRTVLEGQLVVSTTVSLTAVSAARQSQVCLMENIDLTNNFCGQ
jgi:hypothetical protein